MSTKNDIPSPSDGDIPSAGDVPVRPDVDPVDPISPDISGGGNEELVDRTSPEYEFKKNEFINQQQIMNDVDTYAIVEIAMTTGSFLVGWIPILGKIPALIFSLISFIFVILR